jgi:hypothetical protein
LSRRPLIYDSDEVRRFVPVVAKRHLQVSINELPLSGKWSTRLSVSSKW